MQIERMFGSAAVSFDFSVIEFNGIDFDEKWVELKLVYVFLFALSSGSWLNIDSFDKVFTRKRGKKNVREYSMIVRKACEGQVAEREGGSELY
jgi:hypothetical protein